RGDVKRGVARVAYGDWQHFALARCDIAKIQARWGHLDEWRQACASERDIHTRAARIVAVNGERGRLHARRSGRKAQVDGGAGSSGEVERSCRRSHAEQRIVA